MYNREKIIKAMREIKKESDTIKPYVLVAQPRRDSSETPAQNLDGYEGLHIDMLGYSHGFCQISGEKVDVARNYLLDRALESGAKYLLFVGEDTVLPYNGFLKLHETAEKNPDAMVVGVYYIKMSSPMIMVRENDWITPANVEPGRVFEAWQTGLDCALIPINIIQKIRDENPELPFCCIGYQIEDLPFIGEDNFFVHLLRKTGFRLLVNTDVQCLHMDLASGKYTAHPSIKLENYFTNIPITEPLTMTDKMAIDKRWVDRLPKGTANTGVAILEHKTLKDRYDSISKLDGDLTKHLSTLMTYSKKCSHVTEFGFREGVSATAILSGKPKKFITYDIDASYTGAYNLMKQLVPGIDFQFIVADTRTVEIEETDFLFIDCGHSYSQLKTELERHASKVKKYIGFHDTVTWGNKDEFGDGPGLMPAINEFIAKGGWTVDYTTDKNNGLLILSRI